MNARSLFRLAAPVPAGYLLRVPGLSIQQLTRHFPGASVPALAALDLEIAEGEFLAVTGPSGSGKTTLLRLLAGLDAPDAGRIGFGSDQEWHRRSPAERGVAMVGQQPALLPQLTVLENLGLGLKLRKIGAAQTSERVHSMAVRLGLEPLLSRLPASLSGGEQQRVSLGRALVQRPSLFLLDEPLSQLDAPLRADLRREIARLAREFGVTTLHVTHDQAEALELGDRIAVLRGGRLEQVGPPSEILRRPANRFVAEFFSPDGWNELAGTIHFLDGSREFRSSGNRFLLPPSGLRIPKVDGLRVSCLLRPESFLVTNEGDAPGDVLRAWVCADGWRGELETSFGTWRVHLLSGDPPAVGSEVRLAINWDRALWFDPTTGQRLG